MGEMAITHCQSCLEKVRLVHWIAGLCIGNNLFSKPEKRESDYLSPFIGLRSEMTSKPTDSSIKPFHRVYHLSRIRLLIFPIIWVVGVTFCSSLVFSSGEAFTPQANVVLFILLGGATVFTLLFFGLPMIWICWRTGILPSFPH